MQVKILRVFDAFVMRRSCVLDKETRRVEGLANILQLNGADIVNIKFPIPEWQFRLSKNKNAGVAQSRRLKTLRVFDAFVMRRSCVLDKETQRQIAGLVNFYSLMARIW